LRNWLVAACAVLAAGSASAQAVPATRIVDRVAARVNGALILLSDVRAAAALDLIEPGPEAAQIRQMVRRQLLAGEVTRFPPPEPSAADVAARIAQMRARVPDPAALRRDYGLSDGQVEALARESLRIEAYLGQRFGSGVPVSDDQARDYYASHLEEFTRDGVPVPFESVQGQARERATAAGRKEAVERWVAELRDRADVMVPGAGAP